MRTDTARVRAMMSLLAAVPLLASTLAAADELKLEPYAKQGRIVQRLNAFDNPEGSIFSPDGKVLFVSNAAEIGMPKKGFHWTHNGGYISKLSVQPDGTVKMLNERLVEHLTGPLGMAISTVATRKFPRGTMIDVYGFCVH